MPDAKQKISKALPNALISKALPNALIVKIDAHLAQLGLTKDVDNIIDLRKKLHEKIEREKIAGQLSDFKKTPSRKSIDIVINRTDYVSAKQARRVLSMLNAAIKHFSEGKNPIESSSIVKFDSYVEGLHDVISFLKNKISHDDEDEIDHICSLTSKPRQVIEELLNKKCVPREYAIDVVNALRNSPRGHQLNAFPGTSPVSFSPAALHVIAHLDNT